MRQRGCPLCEAAGGHVVVSADKYRIVRADEAGFPAFYRVIWNDHAAEFTDLDAADRALCMDAVARVEALMRRYVRPHKVNLAALGNVVPHLHWHVIARFEWDSHFPSPVWAQAQRTVESELLDPVRDCLPALEEALRKTL